MLLLLLLTVATVRVLFYREAAKVEDETADDGADDGESSAGTEGDENKCWRRCARTDSKGTVKRSGGGSGSDDAEEVRIVEKLAGVWQCASM
jgi:hypothetical protein